MRFGLEGRRPRPPLDPMVNLPNILSMSRILLVPLLMVVLLTKFEGRDIVGLDNEFIGLIIFLIAALTDFLDGFLARRRQQVTRLGQLLDPAADKILTSSAFVAVACMCGGSTYAPHPSACTRPTRARVLARCTPRTRRTRGGTATTAAPSGGGHGRRPTRTSSRPSRKCRCGQEENVPRETYRLLPRLGRLGKTRGGRGCSALRPRTGDVDARGAPVRRPPGQPWRLEPCCSR